MKETQPMSFLSNSQYFPRPRTPLFTKQKGVLSYIRREFSEVTSHLTLPNCKTQSKGWYSCSRMSNSISKSLCSHKKTFLCKLDKNNKMELSENIVLCVMCDVTSRYEALGVFSENYRKQVILSTLIVNISESETIFPLKFPHCSASLPHYTMT